MFKSYLSERASNVIDKGCLAVSHLGAVALVLHISERGDVMDIFVLHNSGTSPFTVGRHRTSVVGWTYFSGILTLEQ